MNPALLSSKDSAQVLRDLPLGMIEFDLDGETLYSNASFASICGQEELPTFVQFLWSSVKTFQQSRDATLTSRFQKADGRLIDLKIDCSLQQDSSGNPSRYVVLVMDITDIQSLKRDYLFHRDILSHAAKGVCLLNAENNAVIYANQKFGALFGCSASNLLNEHFNIFGTQHKGFKPVSKELVFSSISRFGIWRGEVLNRRIDGTMFWSDVVISALEHPDYGDVWISLLEDITDKKQTQETLKRSEKKYRDLFENSRDAILIIENEMFVECNQATLDMLGYKDKKEFLQQHPSRLSPPKQPDGRDSVEKADEMMEIALREGSNRFEWDHVRANGEVFPVEVLLTPLVTEKGVQVIHTVWRDITVQKQQRDQILYQAHYDSLTGLPNRFLALDRLQQLLKKAQRNDKKVAVLFLDLDNFKKVNDTLGHEWGDKILEETAKRLSGAVREADTVGRLGGDEFIILLGQVDDPTDIGVLAGHLVEHFQVPFCLDQRELTLTASIGIACYPDDAQNSSDLLRLADTAMYHSKHAGRNSFHFFTSQMNKEAQRKLLIEQHLHGALERGEFSLHYQPLLKNSEQTIVGAEALLRWHNNSLGNVTPDEFIAVAEQTGDIVNIGEFVISSALQQAAQWQQDFSDNFRIAVNVSPRQFRDSNLIPFIQQCLAEAKISSESLELEVTEGVLLSGHASIKTSLNELNSMGVRLAMDDFGTGYSSMSYLRSYPFDILKIDRSFVRDILQDKADREMVSAMITLSHSLGLKVVAEGVESAEQGHFLKEQDCDYVQGYYYSRPVPQGDFSALLAKAMLTK
ncbi:MAG: EAL domain-containing protein [Aestuariibacter sp.]